MLSTKAVVPHLWPQMQQCVMTQSITLGNTQMSPAPTSAKSLSASNRRSLDTDSHKTRVPPLACSSLIIAPIWRPLPTPAPSPRKKPARWPALGFKQIQCLFHLLCNPDEWRIWAGVHNCTACQQCCAHTRTKSRHGVLTHRERQEGHDRKA